MRTFIAVLALLAAAPTQAVIVGADSHGFELRHSIDLPVAPAQAFAAFAQYGSWWSKDHTYSGNAANLRLSLVPGGCFCESFPGGGGVELG